MIELLDNATRRRIEVLEHLIREDCWLSASDVADYLDVSQKTVSTDLHYISLEWQNFVRVESDTQKRYHVSLRAPSLKPLYRSILNHSESFSLLEAVFLDPNHSVSYWKNYFNFSEATLRRIIDKINAQLKSKHVQLNLNPVALTGEDEIYVRLFMTRYVIEAFDPDQWAIESDNERITRFLYLMYDCVLPETPYMLDDSLLAMFFIGMIRYSQGFKLHKTLMTIDDNLFNEVGSFLKTQWENFQLIFENYPIEYSDSLIKEICTIVFPFYKMHNLQLESELLNVIQFLESSFFAPISALDQTLLATHLQRSIIAHNSVHEDFTLLFDRENSGLNNLKMTYDVFYQLASHALEQVSVIQQSRSKHRLIDSLIMVLFTQWSKLTIALENQKKKVTILCLSRISSQHANLLKDMISNRFDPNVKVIPLFLDGRNRYEEGTKLPHFDIAVSFNQVTTIPAEQLITCDIIPSINDLKRILERVGFIRSYKIENLIQIK